MNSCKTKQAMPPRTAVRNLRHLLHRAIDLVELQAELFKLDTQAGLRSLGAPLGLLAGSLLLVFSASVLFLLALAAVLVEAAGFSVAAALGIACAVGLLLAGTALFAGWRLLGRGLAAYDRSQQELRTNIQWLKDTLKQPSLDDQT